MESNGTPLIIVNAHYVNPMIHDEKDIVKHGGDVSGHRVGTFAHDANDVALQTHPRRMIEHLTCVV